MKFQYNLLPLKLDIKHTYETFLIPESYPEVKNIGPCKVNGFLKKEYEQVQAILNIQTTVLIYDFIDSKEYQLNLDFDLDLIFSDTSKRADYYLDDLKDFDSVILGNILAEIPLSITERIEE